MTRFRKLLLTVLVLLLLLVVGGSILWRSDWLADKIRTRAIAEIYKATGAVASFGNFEWDYSSGIVRIHDVTIRGTETAKDPPFVHIKTAEITLKILSFVNPNVDLRAVRVYEPRVYIITYPDGTTNVPHRQRGRRPDEVLAEFIKLGINRLDAEHGIFSWDHQEIPFDFHGEDLQVAMTLDQNRYRGAVQGEQMSLTLPEIKELKFSLASKVTLENNSVEFEDLQALSNGIRLEASGRLKDWLNPVLTAKVKASGPVHDLVTQFRVPLLNQGQVEANGNVLYQHGWKFSGLVAGKDLGYQDTRFTLRGLNTSGTANYSYTKAAGHQLELTQLRADATQGSFRGSASITSSTYKLRGTVGNIQLDEAQHLIDPSLPSWGALVNGPVLIEGDTAAAKVTAHLALTPTDGEHPLGGNVNLVYDTRGQNLQVTATHLESNATKMDVAGDLEHGIDADLTTTNLAELPYLSRLPIRIESGGMLEFRGLLTGGLNAPVARGQVTVQSVTVQGETIERARMRIDARSNLLKAEQVEIYRGAQTLTGAVQVALFNWEARDSSAIQGQVSVNNIDVSPYLADARGSVKGTEQISGTILDPKLEGDVEWTNATFQTQALGTVTGRVSYDGRQLEIRNGHASLDRQPVDFAGSYSHAPKDLRNGTFQASAKGSGMALERLTQFHDRYPLWNGRLDVDGRVRGRMINGAPDFSQLDGRAVIQQAAYDGKALGALTIRARTEGANLQLTANGVLRGASVTASSQWQLAGLMPGQGEIQVSGAKIDDFQDLVTADPSPLDVRMEANGTFRGNLRQPETLQGNVKVSQLAITPRQAMSDAARRDFTLRNDGPIEIAYDGKGFDIKQARLLAKDTTLTASGLLSLTGSATANLHVVGEANLAVLSALKADLLASGGSTLDLTVRGTVAQPNMAGRMTLRDASFFLRDVPNGLERVNGVVFFDRSRARLENLTAQSGGGTIRLGGFIGFGSELSYQLQAQADNVRVRYPEGVSTSVNTSLTLAGSASRSLLSGSVTLLRAGLNPRTDLGAMIAESSKSSAAPMRIENEFLKNMQFDVRVDTALNAQLTTSLTQNVEAEVNLRLRGTPARPVLIGRTSFTQGEINFFGTKYTIDRGELNFYNQTKIEPVINLDLQTRVRGVIVTINFSGPASKLNLSYRSDPPLQSSEILALLTVGRTPNGSVSSGASVQSPTFLQGASSALLGQAVASPITGRLQRFFGVSRVRIDPQLTGLENAAQARLTIEQQVSRDITVTYIANLNRTQQQVVSVEWDFSREFSALAMRDENGIFGIDFYYRKRFK